MVDGDPPPTVQVCGFQEKPISLNDAPSGVLAPWFPPRQLHVNSSTSPSSPCRPACWVCIGVFTASGAHGMEAATPAYSIG